MIINVGGRTDIVNYYTPWLMNRLSEGYAYSRNPFARENVYKLSLRPEDVDCLLFCSKNYQPILKHIGDIDEKYNILCNYTITAYGKDIEPKVPTINQSIKTLKRLSDIVGSNKILWRYDPILLTEKYTIEKHLETFEYIAEKISPLVYRCIFSFVDMYKKLETNMPEIIILNNNDKIEIAKNIGSIAKKHNMIIQTCATIEDFKQFGILQSGCMTSEILGNANNITFKKVRHSGNRQGCKCIENRNIGDYDTCPNGCKYCYANKNPQIAQENYKKHNPNDLMILGNLKPTDEIQQSNQKSYLENFIQTKLF